MTLMLEWAYPARRYPLAQAIVYCLAELALIYMDKSPEANMKLDVLFIDELGQWSDGYIAVSDIILRHVREWNPLTGV
jgi:hypothetical protein